MKKRFPSLAAALGVLLLCGCAHHRNLPPPEPAAIRALSLELEKLNASVNPGEAERLSACAYVYSIELARQYRAVRPAWWHNVLVNTGFKDRGLCYEWATDLTLKLRELHLFTLEIHWAVARPDTRREHNGVVVCARGQPFEDGIILDAWRYSGRLHWDRVARDEYPWHRGKPLPGAAEAPATAGVPVLRNNP